MSGNLVCEAGGDEELVVQAIDIEKIRRIRSANCYLQINRFDVTLRKASLECCPESTH